ncbi:GGDEF domain-containing protein [Azorhizobium doebereinerae]|uniref:GGDEF domain-containing protein n=1 Tax=Azorhizobium doebereinerae TaxID=281091 RepID=UPI000404EABB|nr:sensor domain-containing diguanylate cyclase [Azorhizobium doebereinerae]
MRTSREPRPNSGAKRLAAPLPRAARLIVPAGIALAVIFAGLIGASLWQGRRDAWTQAERAADNLVLTISRDIQRHFDVFDVLLRSVVRDLQDPAAAMTPQMRQRLLARAMEVGGSTGEMVLLNADGTIVAESTTLAGPPVDAADRDYFLAHRDKADVGLYFSRPFKSRLADGELGIALSRRIQDSEGRFAGVLAVFVRLTYVRDLFAELDRNPRDALILMRDDGVILAREPDLGPAGGAWLDVSSRQNFQRMLTARNGSFTGVAGIDRVLRSYNFSHIPHLPLILAAGLAVDDILGPWRLRASVTGTATLVLCLGTVGIAIALRREIIRRARTEAELALLSLTDGLTGIANRRRFDDISAREWQRALRVGSSIAVLMVDIDRFKLINDRLGHAGGDEVLRAIAQLVQHSLRRPGDLAARYGGEEFAAILPDTELYGAQETAERIRALIEKDVIKDDWPVTVSVGVAAVTASQDRSIGDLISAADRALYRAKENGRNRVAIERMQPRRPAEMNSPA